MAETEQTVRENERVVTRLATDVWSKGDHDALNEIVASDVIAKIPGVPELRGREAYWETVQSYRSAFPDFTVTVAELITADGTVVAEYSVRGTHEGELMGIAPTGKEFEMPGIVIFRVEDGKIVEERNVGDMLGMLQQLGAVPEQPTA